jgi:excisionase family DNA binding protein
VIYWELGTMLTVKQAAARLAVSPSLVYALVAERRLEHLRIGLKRGVIRIPEEAIEEYRRRNAVGARESTPASAEEVRLKLKHLSL